MNKKTAPGLPDFLEEIGRGISGVCIVGKYPILCFKNGHGQPLETGDCTTHLTARPSDRTVLPTALIV